MISFQMTHTHVVFFPSLHEGEKGDKEGGQGLEGRKAVTGLDVMMC